MIDNECGAALRIYSTCICTTTLTNGRFQYIHHCSAMISLATDGEKKCQKKFNLAATTTSTIMACQEFCSVFLFCFCIRKVYAKINSSPAWFLITFWNGHSKVLCFVSVYVI